MPADSRNAALSAILPADEYQAADARIDLQLLEKAPSQLGPDPDRTVSEIIIATLNEAIDDVAGLLGEDWDEWAWGRLHRSRLAHPLANLLPNLSQHTSIGPLPRGGAATQSATPHIHPTSSRAQGQHSGLLSMLGTGMARWL